jgi:hypothetical protein
LIERNSILSFGEQTWKIYDDVEIAHFGSTKVGENLLIRLEPVTEADFAVKRRSCFVERG